MRNLSLAQESSARHLLPTELTLGGSFGFGVSSAYTKVVRLQGNEMTRVLTKYWIVSLLLCLLVAVTPIATADSVRLSSNNVGIYRSADAATLTQAYLSKTQANVSMSRLYARRLQGERFEFDFELSRQLRPSHTHWRGQNLKGSSFQHLNTARNLSQFGRDSLDLANLKGGGKAITSADQFSSAIASPRRTIGLLHGEGNALFRDVCAGGGTGCAHSREFPGSARRPTAVPESGNLTILGTALLVAAGLMRRRFQ